MLPINILNETVQCVQLTYLNMQSVGIGLKVIENIGRYTSSIDKNKCLQFIIYFKAVNFIAVNNSASKNPPKCRANIEYLFSCPL